ncbi:Anthranilate synthase component 2 (plasmid) [Buchnera aphidicola (Mindarus abietinus)]|uniref:glutamine amidotransferase-related protein n=1 Tax=Buchnera aphidicola TaxID=9 RepID=UPI003A68D24E
MKNNILLLDNMDSFTYNLVDQLRTLNQNVLIYRNQINLNIILKKLHKIENPILMLSPGPGKPEEAGCMLKLIKKVKGKVPIIGICLGHQAIIKSYGGEIVSAGEIQHGKSSLIEHDGKEMFLKIPNPFAVARYHSLIGKKIPKTLIINSFLKKIVMSVRNDVDRVCGFQFHPESILTTKGTLFLKEVIRWCSS